MIQRYLKSIKQFADFYGRASREEYWTFIFINAGFTVITLLLDRFLDLVNNDLSLGPVTLFYSLSMTMPTMSLTVRRLHDVGRSGFLMLVLLLPVAGTLWLLFHLAKRGTSGDNLYGVDPRSITSQS